MSAPQLKPKCERKDGKKRQRASGAGAVSGPLKGGSPGNSFTIPKRKKEHKRAKALKAASEGQHKFPTVKRELNQEKRARDAGSGGGNSARMVYVPKQANTLPPMGLGLTGTMPALEASSSTVAPHNPDVGGHVQDRNSAKAMMSLAVVAASVAANDAATEAAAAAAAAAVATTPAPPAPAPPKALGLKKRLHQRVQCDEASANSTPAFSPKKLLKHRLLAAQAHQDAVQAHQNAAASTATPALMPKREMSADHGSVNSSYNRGGDGRDTPAGCRGWYPAAATGENRVASQGEPKDARFDARGDGANRARQGGSGFVVGVGQGDGAARERGLQGRDGGFGGREGGAAGEGALSGRRVGDVNGEYNRQHGMDNMDEGGGGGGDGCVGGGGGDFNTRCVGGAAGGEGNDRDGRDRAIGGDSGYHQADFCAGFDGGRNAPNGVHATAGGVRRGSEEEGGRYAGDVDAVRRRKGGVADDMKWPGGGGDRRDVARQHGYQSSFGQQRPRGQQVRKCGSTWVWAARRESRRRTCCVLMYFTGEGYRLALWLVSLLVGLLGFFRFLV